jgi:hypothetical protein
MRHDTWMERDERTPLEKMQQRMSNLEYEERGLVQRLEETRQKKAKLALQITGLEPATEYGG